MSSLIREELCASRCWVVKFGSALISRNSIDSFDQRMVSWAKQIDRLISDGCNVCVVSSGAIAIGLNRLKIQKRPKDLPTLQAAAAIGQVGLAQEWQQAFYKTGRNTAQILLTHDDLSNRERYLNARDTIRKLIGFGVVPIINENDSVSTDEIRFGDNDSLAALAVNLVEADVLAILTDQDGLFTSDPRQNAKAKMVKQKRALDPDLLKMAGERSGSLGSGGMITKIHAAQLAARSGAITVVGNGLVASAIQRISKGDPNFGTLLLSDTKPQTARKNWLASQKMVKGTVLVDNGAARALLEDGKSLLPVGVLDLTGDFARGDMVSIHGPDGTKIAIGLINYDKHTAMPLIGKKTEFLRQINSDLISDEMIHRDNMALSNNGLIMKKKFN